MSLLFGCWGSILPIHIFASFSLCVICRNPSLFSIRFPVCASKKLLVFCPSFIPCYTVRELTLFIWANLIFSFVGCAFSSSRTSSVRGSAAAQLGPLSLEPGCLRQVAIVLSCPVPSQSHRTASMRTLNPGLTRRGGPRAGIRAVAWEGAPVCVRNYGTLSQARPVEQASA